MKTNISVNPIVFADEKGRRMEIQGGTVEVEYDLKDVPALLKAKAELLPALGNFISTVIMPMFEKVVELDRKKAEVKAALDGDRIAIERNEAEARTKRQNAESKARVADLEAQAREKNARAEKIEAGAM